MSAKAVLTAKPTSFGFDDRVLLLDVPAKIGRSHKLDQGESENARFDCKVLSRHHAILLYEEGRFYLMDTASSNGTFINNVRLSKAGEESPMTEIFSGDGLRFGSDVVEKSSHITQKCVMARVKLFHPSGKEADLRPVDSPLFRPQEEFEDLRIVTQSLKEALFREKNLEQKLLRVRSLISKHIGRSQTDLMRAFEDIKQELMKVDRLPDVQMSNQGIDGKIAAENSTLSRKIHELTRRTDSQDKEVSELRSALRSEELECLALRKACQLQKKQLEEMEAELDEKVRENDQATRALAMKQDKELRGLEEQAADEKSALREKILEVTTNEVNLLNRIKSMEADTGYSRVEMDRMLSRDREVTELKQKLEYRIECLERDLNEANKTIQNHEANVVIQRSPEDVETIGEQEKMISSLRNEISYIKQELIEARAHKSASDDELGNVKGQLDTLENTIGSLSEEGLKLRKRLTDLEENYEAKHSEAEYMKELVDNMEKASTDEEQNRVLILDIKHRLKDAERNLEVRTEEYLRLKQDLKIKDEMVQEREIEISCLRGQIKNLDDELADLKSRTCDRLAVEDHNQTLTKNVDMMKEEMKVLLGENDRLCQELSKQQWLYNELKKMRGKGEEMEMMQSLQKESSDARERTKGLEEQVKDVSRNVKSLTEEKIRLLREVAQLKAGRGTGTGGVEVPPGNEVVYSSMTLTNNGRLEENGDVTVRPTTKADDKSETTSNSLKVYEIMLCLGLITVVLNWILMQ